MDKKHELRQKRHARVRRKVAGTSVRPRLAVFRSVNHIYAQVIDDSQGKTLAAASTMDPELRKSLKSGGNIDAAKVVGKLIGERAIAQGVAMVVFDRGGFMYHGRVQSLAEAAREAGLQF
jgi:large subunit ribosomal protein L18